MNSIGYWCHFSTLNSHNSGETVCAPSAHQIPAGPLWSTGGEFREQPLVVPTQQQSFTKGLIKSDNIPIAWVLLFSQLNAKWQLKQLSLPGYEAALHYYPHWLMVHDPQLWWPHPSTYTVIPFILIVRLKGSQTISWDMSPGWTANIK